MEYKYNVCTNIQAICSPGRKANNPLFVETYHCYNSKACLEKQIGHYLYDTEDKHDAGK